MDHAILSPSAAGRWLTCTPSARLELKFENKESDAAREGTLAHSICEALLNGYKASGVVLLTLPELNFFKTEEFYSESMYEYCKDFALYVLSFFTEGDILSIEQRLDLSTIVPESFGHSDANILQVKKKHLHVFDYKFGKGVPVSAIDNKQLKIYALGVIEGLDFLGYDIEKVTLHIFQPRIQNNSDFTITMPDLLYWMRKQLKPKALLAWEGKGEFVAGEHCFFCNAKATCRALAEYNLELAKLDFQVPETLEDSEILEILEKKKIFESWIKAVEEHVLKEAIKGKSWEGYKLVEGKSNRKYRDETKVYQAIAKAHAKGLLPGISLDGLYKQTFIGIAELTEKLGGEIFETYVTPLLDKPPGAPTLVPEADKRPVYSKSGNDFKDGWSEPIDYSDL